MKRIKGNLFLEHSLRDAFHFFRWAVFSDEIARSKGFLQSLNARVKIIVLIILLLTISLVHDVKWLLFLYLLSVILARLSAIKVSFFIKRVWVFIPLFTIVIALPALFMWGLSSTVLFIARVAASVSFVILAALTTRHHDLLKSLRSLGIPDIFIQVLDMTYRYLSLFISLFEEMHLALKARVIERMKQGRARHWAASRLAYLFRKSVKMSEDVYLAMVARGYTGEYAANENKRRV